MVSARGAEPSSLHSSAPADWEPEWCLEHSVGSSRQNARAVRILDDRREGAAILIQHRVCIEQVRRQNVLGKEGVFAPPRRGQLRLVMPISRTQGRGAPARWYAGHQTTHAPGSLGSATRDARSANSPASGGPRSNVGPKLPSSSIQEEFTGLRDRTRAAHHRSRARPSTPRGSTPSVRSGDRLRSSAVRHWLTSNSPASDVAPMPSWMKGFQPGADAEAVADHAAHPVLA